MDGDGNDTGRLTLNTGSLTVRDIQDRLKSRDISVGVSANINDPFEQGVKGANAPTALETDYIPPSPPENLPTGYTRNADNSINVPSGGKALSTGYTDASGNVIYPRVSGGYYKIGPDGSQIRTGSPKPHGNTLDNTPTEIYRRVNDLDDSYQKTGISNDAHRRYARDELGEDRIDRVGVRPRDQAAKIERFIVERWPGPLNKEPWAGKRNPSHPNYDPDYIPAHQRGN